LVLSKTNKYVGKNTHLYQDARRNNKDEFGRSLYKTKTQNINARHFKIDS